MERCACRGGGRPGAHAGRADYSRATGEDKARARTSPASSSMRNWQRRWGRWLLLDDGLAVLAATTRTGTYVAPRGRPYGTDGESFSFLFF